MRLTSLPAFLPGAGDVKQGDRNKRLSTRWRIHRLETIPVKACTAAAGTVREERQKLPSKDVERQEKLWGKRARCQ